MKKILLSFLLASMALIATAQDQRQLTDINHTVSSTVRYKLYPTANMWTYLKLDTRTGRITQVQYSTGNNEMEVLLGIPYKSISDAEARNGRFELYPTSNMWTFILIDQIDGDVYHVQWNQEKEDRVVTKIQYFPMQ